MGKLCIGVCAMDYVCCMYTPVISWLPRAVSPTTLANTCIFPQSSVAFMIVGANDAVTNWPPTETCQIDHAFSQRLLRFSTLHQRCYILLCSPMLGTNEQKVLSALQEHFLSSGLHFLPVHNASECIENMTTFAKVLCKPLSSVILERLEHVRQRLISDEAVLKIVEKIGLQEFEVHLLVDGCGRLASMAQLSMEELTELSMDGPTAQKVLRLFHEKTPVST